MRYGFLLLSACLLTVMAFQTTASADRKIAPTVTAPVASHPTVDIAILLDTSNSMDGLIDQAKGQLWTIVNEFAAAKRHGLTPVLRVALFEYGNTNLPAREGYIRQVVPLTDDLDTLSEALFALTTRGGDEYCGQVIDEAIKRLDWSAEPNAYKAIFIAGNEPFTQGPVNYVDACQYAIQAGVTVNTIHCGDYQAGIDGMWSHGAKLAEGNYLNINQDKAVIHIDAPQDAELIELNIKLNATYLWYGEDGRVAGARQLAQDQNAGSYGRGNTAKRVASKSSSIYRNTSTDLVDALSEEAVDLNDLDDADLPEVMREMNEEERKAYVEEQTAKRAEIQAKIQELIAERDKYVALKRREMAEASDEVTLGDAVVSSVRQQLNDAGFEVKQEEALPE